MTADTEPTMSYPKLYMETEFKYPVRIQEPKQKAGWLHWLGRRKPIPAESEAIVDYSTRTTLTNWSVRDFAFGGERCCIAGKADSYAEGWEMANRVLDLAWSVTRQDEEIALLRRALLHLVDGHDHVAIVQQDRELIERARAGGSISARKVPGMTYVGHCRSITATGRDCQDARTQGKDAAAVMVMEDKLRHQAFSDTLIASVRTSIDA